MCSSNKIPNLIIFIAYSFLGCFVASVANANAVIFTTTPDAEVYAEVGKDCSVVYEYRIDNVDSANFAGLLLLVAHNDGTNSTLVKVDKDGNNFAAGPGLSSAMANLASRGSVSGESLDKKVTWKFTSISKDDDATLFLCVDLGPSGMRCNGTFQLIAAVKPFFMREKEIFKEGSPVDISCQAAGKPMPDIAWERQDGVMHSNGSGTASLKFEAVSRNDAGIYKCKASNPLGEIESNLEIILHFIDYDKTKTITTIYTFEGASTTLYCGAIGNPPPTIKWTLPAGDISSENGTTLVVTPSSADFKNSYKCSISNSAGTEVIEIQLLNYGKPSVSCDKYDVTVALELSQNTNFTIKYRKKGEETWKEKTIQNEKNKRKAYVDFSNLVEGEYQIKVAAQNKMGRSPETNIKTCSGCSQIVAQLSCVILTFILGRVNWPMI